MAISAPIPNPPSPSRPAPQRARGRAKIGLSSSTPHKTHVTELFQEGCLKARLPHPELVGNMDVILINTAGGLTGGDVLSMEVNLAENARATVTTPACERIYRSTGDEAIIQQNLHVGRHARLDWIPQETILFDQSRLRRRVDIQLEDDAEVLVAEAILFGRAAMGETVKSGFLSDFWTISRDGAVIFADALRISETFEQTMASSATLRSSLAMSSLVYVGQDLESKRDALRTRFAEVDESTAGASIVNDVLVVRIVASSGFALRATLLPALETLREHPLPRNWTY